MTGDRPEVVDPAVDRPVRRVGPAGGRDDTDRVVGEEPLEIRVGGRPLAVMMRTPGDDLDLAAGFLVTEGLVPGPEAIARLRHCAAAAEGPAPGGDEANAVSATLTPGVEVPEERWKRAIAASSACGLCGKVAIEDVLLRAPPVTSDTRVAGAVLRALPARLRAAQPLFGETGGLHAAALFALDGALRLLREDVGRHNAVDKVVGHYVRAGAWPPADSVLLVSGRAGFEIVQKAQVARLPVVAALGAPTSLAVDLAVSGGLTLVAFLREGGFNVYAHPERVTEVSGPGRCSSTAPSPTP